MGEGIKQRDKEQMAAFKCDGWLHITIWDESNSALVKLKHDTEHIPYWSIDVPPDMLSRFPSLKSLGLQLLLFHCLKYSANGEEEFVKYPWILLVCSVTLFSLNGAIS